MCLCLPSSINWYRRKLGVKPALHATHYPFPWTCSFGWCLAEGYGKDISAAPWALWLGKDFSFLMGHDIWGMGRGWSSQATPLHIAICLLACQTQWRRLTNAVWRCFCRAASTISPTARVVWAERSTSGGWSMKAACSFFLPFSSNNTKSGELAVFASSPSRVSYLLSCYWWLAM